MYEENNLQRSGSVDHSELNSNKVDGNRRIDYVNQQRDLNTSQDNRQNSSQQAEPRMQRTSSSKNRTIQTTKKPTEMTALERLKHIQSNFKQQWMGINCEFSGRPGTSNFVNKKRVCTISEGSVQEEER